MRTLSDINTTAIYPFVIVSDPSCSLQDAIEIVQSLPAWCRAFSKHFDAFLHGAGRFLNILVPSCMVQHAF